jgi:hypothetical protein
LGLGTIAQLVPFHRSTSVPDAEDPTAMQWVVLVHDTLFKAMYVSPVGLGLGTTAQLVPFHRSTSVPDTDTPTAKQLVVLVHETLLRAPVRWGLGTVKNGGPPPCGAGADAEAVRGTATPVATSNTTATNRNLTRARPRTVAPSAHTRTTPPSITAPCVPVVNWRRRPTAVCRPRAVKTWAHDR